MQYSGCRVVAWTIEQLKPIDHPTHLDKVPNLDVAIEHTRSGRIFPSVVLCGPAGIECYNARRTLTVALRPFEFDFGIRQAIPGVFKLVVTETA